MPVVPSPSLAVSSIIKTKQLHVKCKTIAPHNSTRYSALSRSATRSSGYAPTSSKIAFSEGDSTKGLYTMNADGSGQSRLTSGDDAAWSPKGTRLIFVGAPDNQFQADLFTIDVDGSNRTNLTNTPNESEFNPNWQPVFAPPDTTAPKVESVSPADGTKGVARSSTVVTAKFSEAVDQATLTPANVQLFSGSSTKPVKAALSKTSTSVTLTPSSKLDAKTKYTAQIKEGQIGVKDLAGNPLAADFSWSFTTRSM